MDKENFDKPVRLFHHAAVGIITDKDGRLFMTERPLHKIKGGYWEFPGGKIEKEEAPEAALIRELKEEVGIDVLHYSKLMHYTHTYSEEAYEVLLEVFQVTGYEGTPVGAEGQNVAWVHPKELKNYLLLEPNIRILEALMSAPVL